MATTEVNGVDLFWHEAGTEHKGAGPGRTIVFVHGFQGNAGVWRKQFETLTSRYHTVCLNNRGRSPSEQPEGVENYTLDHFAADLDAFIEKQGYESITLVGWSMGVSTCLQYLKNHGQSRVACLILVDGSPNFQKFPRPAEAAAAIEAANAAAAKREVAPPGATTAVWGEEFGAISADCMQGSMDAIQASDFLSFLGEITVPTEVFHGRSDERIPFEAGEALALEIPGARLRNFTVSGHSPMWTEPGRFDREIIHFIGRVTSDADEREKFANQSANQRYKRQ
jgi:non-heme chloroperoxidase